MKHLLWMACLICLGAHSLKAQDSKPSSSAIDSVYARRTVIENTPRNLYYGLRIGASLSSLGTDADSTSNKVGLLLGAFVGKDISTQLSVWAGLQYLKMGSTIDSEMAQIGLQSAPSGVTLNASYSYIALPVNVRYFPSDKHGLFVEGGLQASVLLRAELIGLGGDFQEAEGYIDIKDQLSGLDIAPSIGVGYEWGKNLSFSLSYQLGMLNTLSDSNLRVNNRGWQFALGYTF